MTPSTAPGWCNECSTRTVRLCADDILKCTRCEWRPDQPETGKTGIEHARQIRAAIARDTDTPKETP